MVKSENYWWFSSCYLIHSPHANLACCSQSCLLQDPVQDHTLHLAVSTFSLLERRRARLPWVWSGAAGVGKMGVPGLWQVGRSRWPSSGVSGNQLMARMKTDLSPNTSEGGCFLGEPLESSDRQCRSKAQTRKVFKDVAFPDTLGHQPLTMGLPPGLHACRA